MPFSAIKAYLQIKARLQLTWKEIKEKFSLILWDIYIRAGRVINILKIFDEKRGFEYGEGKCGDE